MSLSGLTRQSIKRGGNTPFFYMRKYLSVLLIFLVLFTSCTTLRQQELDVSLYVPEAFEWEEVCPGVARYDFENREIPLIYHAVKIDLKMISENGPLELICSRGEKVSDVALRENCIVAVNATPFDKAGNLVGIHREKGETLSKPVARYAAIAFDDGHAQIFTSQSEEGLSEYPFAFGGFFTVLEHGEVRRDLIARRDSRSGAGLSADGTTLYLLVVEGEHPQHSSGLSYPECGEIILAMGCHDALEFDGGGSAKLCINKKSVLSYKVRRIVGNCFGIRSYAD